MSDRDSPPPPPRPPPPLDYMAEQDEDVGLDQYKSWPHRSRVSPGERPGPSEDSGSAPGSARSSGSQPWSRNKSAMLKQQRQEAASVQPRNTEPTRSSHPSVHHPGHAGSSSEGISASGSTPSLETRSRSRSRSRSGSRPTSESYHSDNSLLGTSRAEDRYVPPPSYESLTHSPEYVAPSSRSTENVSSRRSPRASRDRSPGPRSSGSTSDSIPRVAQKYVLVDPKQLARNKPFSQARGEPKSGKEWEAVELRALNPSRTEGSPSGGRTVSIGGYSPMKRSPDKSQTSRQSPPGPDMRDVVDEPVDEVDPPFSISTVAVPEGDSTPSTDLDAEDSSSQRQDKNKRLCTACWCFSCRCESCERAIPPKMREKRLRWLIYAMPIFLLICLFIIFMPFNFVYLEHYQMALLRTKSTGVVDKDVTYYSGCHLLGPNTEFVIFSMTGHLVEKTLDVFCASKLHIVMSLKLLYFIKPEELGQLYIKYGSGHEDIIDKVLVSQIKTAASPLTLDTVRLERHLVEEVLHNSTRKKLTELHVDVRHLWLGKIDIPHEVSGQFMHSLLQKVSAETEQFKQNYKLVEKETEELQQNYSNRAEEVKQHAATIGSLIKSRAKTQAKKIVDSAIKNGWKHMCQKLGFTEEDHKLSIFYIHNLNKMDNLYMAPSEPGNNFNYSHYLGTF